MTHLLISLAVFILILNWTLRSISIIASKNTIELQALLLEARPGSIVRPNSFSWYILTHPLTIPSWVTLEGVRIIQPQNKPAIYMSDNSRLELSSLRGDGTNSGHGFYFDSQTTRKTIDTDHIGLVYIKGTGVNVINVDIRGAHTGVYVDGKACCNSIIGCSIQPISYRWYHRAMYKVLCWFLRLAIFAY